MQQNELSRIVSLVNKKHDKYDRVSAVSRTKKRAEVFRHGRVIFIGNFEMTMDFLKDMMN